MINNCEDILIPQAEYAKKLRPLLPTQAFTPDPSKLAILLINLAILILGWAIARQLDSLPIYCLWLYSPFILIMGNSVTVLLFSSHELMHGCVIRKYHLIRVFGLLGLAIGWMPPTLWKILHNQEHHKKTNSVTDPDRNYLYEQSNSWGKSIQNMLVPSAEVNPIGLIVGMAIGWGVHSFRHLTSVLLFNNKSVNYNPASLTVSAKERRYIIFEFCLILIIHLSILTYLQFNFQTILLSYFLPISIGYAVAMFYIYTNHMLCRMTSINDPLLNSVSLRVPKIINTLHLNFSYHTEHHIFPGINFDYYPIVQELLKEYYPERFNLLDAQDAWRLLLQTPRHYKDENTFTDYCGEKSVPCAIIKTWKK